MKVSLEQAKKVYDFVNAGLVSGLGEPVAGQLCVEAAICLAMGEPHGDAPPCVGAQDREFSIALNDAAWSSPQVRAAGFRRLAIAQLGSIDLTPERRKEWLRLLVTGTVNKIVPIALMAAASIHHDKAHKEALELAAKGCESAAWSAAWSASAASAAARSAASAAWSARSAESARDEVLCVMAEIAVDAYIKINAPGAVLLKEIEAEGGAK